MKGKATICAEDMYRPERHTCLLGASAKSPSEWPENQSPTLLACAADAGYSATELAEALSCLHPTFVKSLEFLQPKLDRLVRMRPCSYGHLPNAMPRQGIYLFSENESHLYIGRSSKLRTSYGRHCNPSATVRTADFAFRLATLVDGKRSSMGNLSEHNRKFLALDRKFCAAFDSAKERIRQMAFRFVEECDSNEQVLLEVYGSVVLKTTYNDFGTR